MAVVRERFDNLSDGREVISYLLTNRKGSSVRLINLGATIVDVNVPDRDGKLENISLGFDKAAQYAGKDSCYFGAAVGRYANRISGSRFTLNGKEYGLFENGAGVTLHGGREGFDKKLWDAKAGEAPESGWVEFSRLSPDGEEGFPGNLTVTIKYVFNDADELSIEYAYESDADTFVNLTNHVYFNLEGHDAGTVEDHTARINARCFTPLSELLVPDGSLAPVEGTPYDLRTPKRLGDGIDSPHEQIQRGGGYDINFAVDGEGFRYMATVYSPKTGRAVDCHSDLPGIQLYSGNFMTNGIHGRGGATYNRRGGLCLETQYYPNALNIPAFKAPLLKAGEKGYTKTVYRFYVK